MLIRDIMNVVDVKIGPDQCSTRFRKGEPSEKKVTYTISMTQYDICVWG